jgi:hypothetical protein
MAINTSKVVVGGLVAGVVANVVGYLGFGVMLGKRMEAEAVAVAPALQGRGMSSGAITTNVIASFVLGLLLVWLYAAMRPRFGPGPKTATYAALAVWVTGVLFHLDWLVVGMATTATYVLASVAGLAQALAASLVGAAIYKEPETVA